jgi:transposase
MIRLTDGQWERIRKHFPEEHNPDGRPGRKPIPTRHVLETVLWILNTGAQWHMLPQSYPNAKLCIGAFKLGAATRFCVGF